jgi:hypothetical protein
MTEKDTEMITPYLKIDLAQERTDYRSRAAIARGRTQPRAHGGRPVASEKGVTLRFGSRADEASLARLAALDSSKPPAQPVLLAEVDGQLLAAVALSDGTVIADPFHPTLDLIELLRARARQLNGDSRIMRSGRWRLRSLRRAAARG